MSKIKSFLGYMLAVLGVPIILLTFMGASTWMELLVSTTGLEISPLYTGGDVAYTFSQNEMKIAIHEPVFEALIGESSEGFVQVTFSPKQVSRLVDVDVDYDDDGVADFHVWWDTMTADATITPYSSLVLGLEGAYELGESYAVRVRLLNPGK